MSFASKCAIVKKASPINEDYSRRPVTFLSCCVLLYPLIEKLRIISLSFICNFLSIYNETGLVTLSSHTPFKKQKGEGGEERGIKTGYVHVHSCNSKWAYILVGIKHRIFKVNLWSMHKQYLKYIIFSFGLLADLKRILCAL